MLLSIPGLPFDWWGQFRLEAKFGFNKSTPALWVSDQIKSTLLGLALGFPLAWGLLALVSWVGSTWWVWGFALLFCFQLLMLVLYPKLILPLFNKLSPLPDGEQRTRKRLGLWHSFSRCREFEKVLCGLNSTRNDGPT